MAFLLEFVLQCTFPDLSIYPERFLVTSDKIYFDTNFSKVIRKKHSGMFFKETTMLLTFNAKLSRYNTDYDKDTKDSTSYFFSP